MSYKHNIIKERFDLTITEANQVFRGEFELDKNANFLLGILITSDRDDLLFYRGSQKVQFNDSELFPEGFESKLLMAGINVSPNRRMVKVGSIPVGNGKLDVSFKDIDHPSATFENYRVSFYAFSIVNNENK